MNISFVKASDIQTDVSMLMNDVGKSRWTQAMLDAAYNMAVSLWQQRQSIPVVLDSTNSDLVSGWDSGVNVYDLPLGVQGGGIRPQYRRTPWMGTGIPVTGSTQDTWGDLVSYTMEPPSSAGGRWKIRFNNSPYTSDARLIVNVNNTRLPAAATTLGAALSAANDQVPTITPAWTGDQQGFVQIDSEVLAFFGAQPGTSFNNVARGLTGGVASHLISAPISPLFAFEESGDRAGFTDTIMGICHRMYLNNASSSDNSFHQQMVTYYDNRVQQFWRTRPVRRGTRSVLTEFGMVR